MNKAITDGIDFMPPAFADGLDVWSRGDGTPGSDTYEIDVNAAFVPGDQDFGGALEVIKTDALQKLRYMGETPILPGCYLQIRVRVKAISGALPDIRIAGWAGDESGAHVPGLAETAAQTSLDEYGKVVELDAIVGTSLRGGVDMVWGTGPVYGHFGLDLTGPDGGVLRIDDIEIEDVTRYFLPDTLPWVDVRDHGAVGDGETDDSAAFEAADTAAAGREVMIPEGTYFLGESVTMQSRTLFRGTVTMPGDRILALTGNFDLPAYIAAFGDGELAFRKAYQALLNNAGYESLDMKGRKIAVTAPIDMQAAVANRGTYKQRHVIRNGQLSAVSGPAWDTVAVTSQASYSPADPKTLSNVANVANIPVGALVEGSGVGREVYVRSKSTGAGTVTLSAPLHDAAGTQVFTFRRFAYLLDFSGFDQISKFAISNVDFQCAGACSAILLPPSGTGFHLRDCFVTRPRDRGITSHGEGDQGMMIDRCQFLSDESPLNVPERVSIGLNANGNDVKLRDNRIVHFRHFAVLGGSSSIITGNHVFQGDTAQGGVRTAGLVLTRTNNRGTITGNYIDNCFIEWANEHDHAPEFASEFSFSSLSITGNVFLASDTAPWFTFIAVKPHGAGHFINGLAVTGNTFRMINGVLDRVEQVDTGFADFDYNRFRNIRFAGNAFHNVATPSVNPLLMEHEQATPAATWTVVPAPKLPFGGWVQTVESVIAAGPLRDGGGDIHFGAPYYQAKQGPDKDRVHLQWGTPVEGTVTLRVRIDDPQ